MFYKQRFPKINQELETILQKCIKLIAKRIDPVFGRIPEKPIPEGRILEIIKENKTSKINLNEFISRITIKKEDIRSTNLDAFVLEVIKMIKDTGEKMARFFFREIDSILTEAGQIIDAGGREFDFDTLLEIFKKIEIPFDKDGNPRLDRYKFVLNPKLYNKIVPKLQEWERDPEKHNRFNALIEQKRKEYYAKEASRKLLD